ncbi:hypothetical protein AB0D04_26860 [Streptomyces sp. NPDC048483]|uniref:hypothetical protein n=1 Tax=Streptomyces sp. NPDC048483 TaxID=3154927 RepID=UPI003446834B
MPDPPALCPRCEQDLIRPYRFKDDGTAFCLCAECDSLWWPHEAKQVATARFLDDVVAARLGDSNPCSARVWADVIEPVCAGHRP